MIKLGSAKYEVNARVGEDRLTQLPHLQGICSIFKWLCKRIQNAIMCLYKHFYHTREVTHFAFVPAQNAPSRLPYEHCYSHSPSQLAHQTWLASTPASAESLEECTGLRVNVKWHNTMLTFQNVQCLFFGSCDLILFPGGWSAGLRVLY